MDDFQITTEIAEPGIVVMSIKGSLDSNTVDELTDTFKEFFDQHIYRFIVDLSQTDHIRSAGIGVFIGVLDALEQNKGTIVFVNPNPKVKEAFEMFQLPAFYMITGDRTSALSSIKIRTFSQEKGKDDKGK